MPDTPASAKDAMHRSQRTGEATWSTSRSTKSRPDATAAPSRLVQSRTRGIGCRDLGGRGAQRLDGRRHVAGVEGARDLERDDAGAGGRLRGERLERVERAGGDELAAAVVVGGREVELVEAGDDGMPRRRR